MGLRLQKLISDLISHEVTNEDLGQRVRSFVVDEGPHFMGMVTQLLWDRLSTPAEDDDTGEDEFDEENDEDIVDCPSCGLAIEAKKGVPDSPCPKCGLDFKTGMIPCAKCRELMMPDAKDAFIVETKTGGQRIYHEDCKPSGDEVVGVPKIARHPEKRA